MVRWGLCWTKRWNKTQLEATRKGKVTVAIRILLFAKNPRPDR